MSTKSFLATTWTLIVLAFVGVSAQAAEKADLRLSAQDARQLAAVTRQLNELAIKHDENHDQELSPGEQEALIGDVETQHGAAWAKRAKAFLASADANSDQLLSFAEWKQAVASLAKLNDKAPEAEPSVKTYMVEMKDGVKLATDVYLPAGDGPFPIIFTRTPYGRADHGKRLLEFAQSGDYAVVAQDMRGRFDSEGENLPFIGCGWHEHQDGVDTLAWIHQQPWSNGKLCTVGGSAGGITQNLLAGATPPGLTAQYISVAAASMFHDATYVGGALRKCQVENWSTKNRFSPKALELMRAHPQYDDYWRAFDTRTRFAQMNVPAVHLGGWFDTFSQGTIDEFCGRQYHGAAGSRGNQKLVMGPWTHATGKNEQDAELVFPNPEVPDAYAVTQWFADHLMGTDHGVMRAPAVAYYVMGDVNDADAPGNEWRFADAWPITHRSTPYYFQSGGELSPLRRNRSDKVSYTFDPADPCPTVGGPNLTIARGPKNQNRIESRDDLVLFTSKQLTEPLEVTGRIAAEVYVASSAVDSDVSIRLCDVYPDGRSYNIAEGMLRLRFRNSLESPELLKPGEIVKVAVDCWSTSIVFNRGHCIRVSVTSSNHPRFDVNPGTGQPWNDGDHHVKQINTIYCDADHPSHILLPVVSTADR